jgi:hypothetical protein
MCKYVPISVTSVHTLCHSVAHYLAARSAYPTLAWPNNSLDRRSRMWHDACNVVQRRTAHEAPGEMAQADAMPSGSDEATSEARGAGSLARLALVTVLSNPRDGRVARCLTHSALSPSRHGAITALRGTQGERGTHPGMICRAHRSLAAIGGERGEVIAGRTHRSTIHNTPGERPMRYGRRHVRLGHGTGSGYARTNAAERAAFKREAESIRARVMARLHGEAQ